MPPWLLLERFNIYVKYSPGKNYLDDNNNII